MSKGHGYEGVIEETAPKPVENIECTHESGESVKLTEVLVLVLARRSLSNCQDLWILGGPEPGADVTSGA